MKPLFTSGLVLGQALVILLAVKAGEAFRFRGAVVKSWDAYTSEIPAGTALNPVPLKVGQYNPAILIRGSYLVNAQQHCNFCHTCPPYATDGSTDQQGILPPINAVNYMAGGRRFGAPGDTNAPLSANLTPDLKTGLPGGLTLDGFRLVLRTGRAHKTGRKLEAMPWPMFHDMTDSELVAMYEYLSAIPHAEPGAEQKSVPGFHIETHPKAND